MVLKVVNFLSHSVNILSQPCQHFVCLKIWYRRFGELKFRKRKKSEDKTMYDEEKCINDRGRVTRPAVDCFCDLDVR